MKYEILVWLVARLFGFRRGAEDATQDNTEFVSTIDFMGSMGVGVLAALPVFAVSRIVDLFVNNPQFPWIGWVQKILTVVGMFVMVLAMFTWNAFLVHLRHHRWAEFSAHNQRQLRLLARIVPPFYCAVGMLFGLLFAIILMVNQHWPWWAGALTFVALFWVGDMYRQQTSWGITVLDKMGQ